MSHRDDRCKCGHARHQHIYDEGACRPGFECYSKCTEFKLHVPAGMVEYAVVKKNKRQDWPMGSPIHMRCTYQYSDQYNRQNFSPGMIAADELAEKNCVLCNDDWVDGPHRLKPIGHAVSCGCLNCGSKPEVAPMEMVIAVGFGSAYVSRDGECVLDGEGSYHDEGPQVTFADAEKLYLADPDHDWRVTLDGPLGGVVYQRHDEGWVACIRLPGFA